jgi:hypothetical protein
MEAATRTYEKTRDRPIAIAAEAFNNSNDQILTWYCYEMTRPRDDGQPPLVILQGTRPPSRLNEKIDVALLSNYDFRVENDEIVLQERTGNVRYKNLTVSRGEVAAAIKDMAKREV